MLLENGLGEWLLGCGKNLPKISETIPNLSTSGGFSECSISMLRIDMVRAEETRQISGWCRNGTQRMLRHEQACSCASSVSSCSQIPALWPSWQSRDQAGMSCLLSKASFLSNQ